MDDASLLQGLEGEARRLLERHLSSAKEWFPHELVPWSRGRDFVPGEAWDPSEVPMDAAVRSALYVNLLTEDNLPYYLNSIDRMFGSDSVWGTWVRRWTAEEGRHSIVIRDYLTVTRSIDPVHLERGRMHQMSEGYYDALGTAADGFVYLALQELATRIAHRNTGKMLDDPVGYEVMARVAVDENLHYLFYKDMVAAALELDPSGTMCAIERQVRAFEMPGAEGIPDFSRHAAAIAKAGIYDFEIHHDQVLVPAVLRQWGVESLEGLDAEGEQARARLVRHLQRVRKAAHRVAERRAEAEAEARATTPVG
jgi:acyl-[acyl-carrier-protein] desaturase